MGKARKGILGRKNGLVKAQEYKRHIFRFLVEDTGLQPWLGQDGELGTKRQRLALKVQLGHQLALCVWGNHITFKGFYFFPWAGELSRATLKGSDYHVKENSLSTSIKIF